jgi:hypothetical protein
MTLCDPLSNVFSLFRFPSLNFCHNGVFCLVGENDKDKRLNDKLSVFRATYCKGKLSIPVAMLASPATDLLSRPIDTKWVVELTKSFIQLRSVNEDLYVVLRTNEKIQELSVENLAKLDAKLEVIGGNHSLHAARDLARRFPMNPLWQSLVCNVFICPDTGSNRDCLRAIAGLDNRRKNKVRMTTTVEMVIAAHQTIQAELSHFQVLPGGAIPSEARSRVTELLRDMCESYGQGSNTWGSIAVLARKTGQVWNLLEQLLTGTNMDKHYEIPTSITAFQYLGGDLDPDQQVNLLQGVVTGLYPLKKLPNWCRQTKAKNLIRKFCRQALVEYSSKKAQVGSLSWEELCKLYPKTTDAVYLDSFVSVVMSSKVADGCPPELLRLLRDNIGFDESLVRSEVLLSLLLLVCLYHI